MKVSRNWIETYVDLSGITDDAISHALTMVGFEVEEVVKTGLPPLENVVVGEVVSYEQHPNADRLSVCQVVTMEGGDARTIVCGAKNFAAGDRVIVALPGAVLPGDFKIKESKLRGVVSGGMMCSERELGLGEDHEGIAILSDRPALGTPVNDLYGGGDTVFDVEITPNRPDALSQIGIAREMAAWFKRDLRYPEIQHNLSEWSGRHLVDTVVSDTPENCPHYRGYSVRGVNVGESPAWLKERLKSIGLRPINNVVDVTNFVLHELGQPLHAFDAAKIRGGEIRVRMAGAGESIVTLDEKKRVLDPGMMVIADGERALVIAGVMGSVDAEVDETTTDIFLESAYFNPSTVRRASRTLGLSTDSSYRFERGVDPKGTEFAALRCLDLILEVAGGELQGAPLVAGEAPLIEKEISLSPAYVRRVLGFELSDEVIAENLRALELDVTETTDDDDEALFLVGIPSFRLDLYRPIDLVEEILRIYGSDKVPPADVRTRGLLAEDDPVPVYLRKASSLLMGRGYSEVMNYSLGEADVVRDWFGKVAGDVLTLANPLASDASHLRPSLIPGLLQTLAFNAARGQHPPPVFECGRVFREVNGAVYEYVSVAFAEMRDSAEGWLKRAPVDFYAAARTAADLLGAAGVKASPHAFQANPSDDVWQKGHAAHFGSIEGGHEAEFGLLAPGALQRWDLPGPVVVGAVYFLPEFLKKPVARRRYQPFSVFPAAVRDLAVVAPVETPAGDVAETLTRIGRTVCAEAAFDLEGVEVFDVYEGKGLPEGSRSLAFSLTFRSLERTLTDKEVNAVFDRLQADLQKDTPFRVRS